MKIVKEKGERRVTLFYFALIIGGIIMVFNDKKELNKFVTAVETYPKAFKIATLSYILILGMTLFTPLRFIDFSMFALPALFYFLIGSILYVLYKRQPLKVLTLVSLLHVLGILLRIALEWQSPTIRSMTFVNLIINAAVVPLYIYIIQLILALKRFSSK